MMHCLKIGHRRHAGGQCAPDPFKPIGNTVDNSPEGVKQKALRLIYRQVLRGKVSPEI
jgi:hypothetical protein